MSVTGCSYGVHAFSFAQAFGAPQSNLHLHECDECGAAYIRPGVDGCSECVTPPRGWLRCDPGGCSEPCSECQP